MSVRATGDFPAKLTTRSQQSSIATVKPQALGVIGKCLHVLKVDFWQGPKSSRVCTQNIKFYFCPRSHTVFSFLVSGLPSLHPNGRYSSIKRIQNGLLKDTKYTDSFAYAFKEITVYILCPTLPEKKAHFKQQRFHMTRIAIMHWYMSMYILIDCSFLLHSFTITCVTLN